MGLGHWSLREMIDLQDIVRRKVIQSGLDCIAD